jgi:hypothetical protein
LIAAALENNKNRWLKINEFALKNSACLDGKSFIELKSRVSEMKLEDYKLVGITLNQFRPHGSASIDMVIELNQFKTDNAGFWTVGGSSINEASYRKEDNRPGWQNMIKDRCNTWVRSRNYNMNEVYYRPYALLLLFDPQRTFKFQASPKALTPEDIIRISKLVYDMYAFREEVAGDWTAEAYENIYYPYKENRYILSPFKSKDSLSRCDFEKITKNQNFMPTLFKHVTTRTINSENDCTGDYLINNIPTTTITIANPEDDIEMTTGLVGQSQIDDPIPNDDNNCSVNDAIQTCELNSEIQHETRVLNLRRNGQVNIDEWWEDDRFFNDLWLGQVKENQFNYFSVATVNSSRNWIEYIYNSKNPKRSILRCHICFNHGSKSGRSSHIPDLSKENGLFSLNKKKMVRKSENILKHLIIYQQKEPF